MLLIQYMILRTFALTMRQRTNLRGDFLICFGMYQKTLIYHQIRFLSQYEGQLPFLAVDAGAGGAEGALADSHDAQDVLVALALIL